MWWTVFKQKSMHSLQVLTNILRIAEAAACVCGFLTWQRWRSTPFKWYTFYLLFIVVAESLAAWSRPYKLDSLRVDFFTYIVVPCEFLSTFALFAAVAKTRKTKWLPVLCAGIYLVSLVVNAVFLEGRQHVYDSFNYTVGNLLMLVLIMSFIGRLLTSDDVLYFRHNIMFWFCSGWLLFYLGTLPYYGLSNILVYQYPEIYRAYSYLAYALNIIMYLLFAAGYIWGKPRS